MELEILAFGMKQCSDADPFILDFLQKKQERDEASFFRYPPSKTGGIYSPPYLKGTINNEEFKYIYYDIDTVEGKAMECFHDVKGRIPTIIICKEGKETSRFDRKPSYDELNKAVLKNPNLGSKENKPLPSFSGEFGPNERHAPKQGSPGPVDGPSVMGPRRGDHGPFGKHPNLKDNGYVHPDKHH